MNPQIDVPWEVLRQYNYIVKRHRVSKTDRNTILLIAEQLDLHALAKFILEKQKDGFHALLEKVATVEAERQRRHQLRRKEKREKQAKDRLE